MADQKFAYIWRYTIRSARKSEFLLAYEADGEWAKLFAKDTNYIRTDLLRDVADSDVYVTIDYWTSKAARDSFREEHSESFNALDRRCEAYTVSEAFIGDFVVSSGSAT